MRTEDPRFLTTGGVYTADVEDEQLAGACHVHFVRSAVAHARIRSIDLSAALKAPGVIAAFTGADLAGLPGQAPPMPEGINTPMGQPRPARPAVGATPGGAGGGGARGRRGSTPGGGPSHCPPGTWCGTRGSGSRWSSPRAGTR